MCSNSLTSPCISVCEINKATGFCNGCYRTIREIADWPYLDYDQQMILLNNLRKRQGKTKRINRRRN